jgi:hypothetical protein
MSLFEQLSNTQRRGLPFPTHTHTKEKQQLKLQTLKTIMKKPKQGAGGSTRKNKNK